MVEDGKKTLSNRKDELETITIIFCRHFYNETEERIMQRKIQLREKCVIDFQRSIEYQKRQKERDEK